VKKIEELKKNSKNNDGQRNLDSKLKRSNRDNCILIMQGPIRDHQIQLEEDLLKIEMKLISQKSHPSNHLTEKDHKVVWGEVVLELGWPDQDQIKNFIKNWIQMTTTREKNLLRGK
jgi:hypothetical protein